MLAGGEGTVGALFLAAGSGERTADPGGGARGLPVERGEYGP